jgi:hypothetical protein
MSTMIVLAKVYLTKQILPRNQLVKIVMIIMVCSVYCVT